MPISLSQHAFTPKQVITNEAQVANQKGIEMYSLMECAGISVMKEITALQLRAKCLLVICGAGNNGGDGFVVARIALEAGFKVSVIVLTKEENISGNALTAYQKLVAKNAALHFIVHIKEFQSVIAAFAPDIVVDAIFGIGFRDKLPVLTEQVITQLNKITALKISVDVPSGVNALTGSVETIAFIADVTVCFIAHKCGLYTGRAVDFTGQIKLYSLGLSDLFCHQIHTDIYLQNGQNTPKLPMRKKSLHKGHIGLLLAIGSNKNMPGAIRLASQAALKTGASLVAVASHQQCQTIIHSQQAELMVAGDNACSLVDNMTLLKTKQLLIGPGLGVDEWASDLFHYALSLNKPMVVDADALNLLSESPSYNEHWVLTPHPGEAARLLGCTIDEIEQDRFTAVFKISQKYGGICVLKGAGTLICHGQQCWINTSGNPSMASGGMGDVLSGIIAALLMQMSDKLAAVRLAVFLHGFIADQLVEQQGPIGLLASDIIYHIPSFINKMT